MVLPLLGLGSAVGAGVGSMAVSGIGSIAGGALSGIGSIAGGALSGIGSIAGGLLRGRGENNENQDRISLVPRIESPQLTNDQLPAPISSRAITVAPSKRNTELSRISITKEKENTVLQKILFTLQQNNRILNNQSKLLTEINGSLVTELKNDALQNRIMRDQPDPEPKDPKDPGLISRVGQKIKKPGMLGPLIGLAALNAGAFALDKIGKDWEGFKEKVNETVTSIQNIIESIENTVQTVKDVYNKVKQAGINVKENFDKVGENFKKNVLTPLRDGTFWKRLFRQDEFQNERTGNVRNQNEALEVIEDTQGQIKRGAATKERLNRVNSLVETWFGIGTDSQYLSPAQQKKQIKQTERALEVWRGNRSPDGADLTNIPRGMAPEIPGDMGLILSTRNNNKPGINPYVTQSVSNALANKLSVVQEQNQSNMRRAAQQTKTQETVKSLNQDFSPRNMQQMTTNIQNVYNDNKSFFGGSSNSGGSLIPDSARVNITNLPASQLGLLRAVAG